jgi:hypothetical protein
MHMKNTYKIFIILFVILFICSFFLYKNSPHYNIVSSCKEKNKIIPLTIEGAEIWISCYPWLYVSHFNILTSSNFIHQNNNVKKIWFGSDNKRLYLLNQVTNKYNITYYIQTSLDFINLSSFKNMWNGFFQDINHVYIWYFYENSIKTQKIDSLDASTFKIINNSHYLEDKNWIYYYDFNNWYFEIRQIDKVKAQTFDKLYNDIYHDGNHLIYKWKIQEHINKNSFKWVYKWWGYYLDNKHVYSNDLQVLDLNPRSTLWFYYNNARYISDGKNAYLVSEIYNPSKKQRRELEKPIQVPYHKELQRKYQEQHINIKNDVY